MNSSQNLCRAAGSLITLLDAEHDALLVKISTDEGLDDWGEVVGALDMVLHDLWGKATGRSISNLYGGRMHDRVPVYAPALSCIEGVEPADRCSWPMRHGLWACRVCHTEAAHESARSRRATASVH